MKHRLQGDKKTHASDSQNLGLFLAPLWLVLVLQVVFCALFPLLTQPFLTQNFLYSLSNFIDILARWL